jgi:hypothetical protein
VGPGIFGIKGQGIPVEVECFFGLIPSKPYIALVNEGTSQLFRGCRQIIFHKGTAIFISFAAAAGTGVIPLDGQQKNTSSRNLKMFLIFQAMPAKRKDDHCQ